MNDLQFGTDFLDTVPKVWSLKEIINKLNFIKSKNIYIVKRYCQENESTSHTEKKLFSKGTSDKGLLSKIYKELLKVNY